jgi:hypothetical protein
MLEFLNKKLHTPTWLFVLLLVILVLRIPSFFEPYSYGDEMIYLTLGDAINKGVPLYKAIHDNKPPLLYIMAAIAGSLFWFKAILTIWVLLTIYVFWKLTQALFKKRVKFQIIATVVFATLTTVPLLEGNIANAELFMIGPTILAFYLLLSRKLTIKNLVLSGFLFSISALFKIPAAFDVPAIVLYWFFNLKKLDKESLIKIVRHTLVLVSAFLVPIALTFVWFTFKGAFKEYLTAAFLQNFGYLSSWRPSDIQKPFLVRNAPLLIRAGIVALVAAVLFKLRKKLSKQFLFTSMWLFLTLFAVTLSERPYPHYLIQSVAPISILIAMLFTKKNIEQVLIIVPLFFAALVPFYYRFWHYPTLPYYERFIKFATGNMSKEEYLNSFGAQVPRNYKIANFITTSTKPYEKVFVWGDGTPIYALSRRLPPGKYVADYHIKDFSSEAEIINGLKQDEPSLIVILPNSQPFPELEFFIKHNYGLTENVDGAEIWKLLSPQVRSLFSS